VNGVGGGKASEGVRREDGAVYFSERPHPDARTWLHRMGSLPYIWRARGGPRAEGTPDQREPFVIYYWRSILSSEAYRMYLQRVGRVR
jgi:hypothetical protein